MSSSGSDPWSPTPPEHDSADDDDVSCFCVSLCEGSLPLLAALPSGKSPENSMRPGGTAGAAEWPGAGKVAADADEAVGGSELESPNVSEDVGDVAAAAIARGCKGRERLRLITCN